MINREKGCNGITFFAILPISPKFNWAKSPISPKFEDKKQPGDTTRLQRETLAGSHIMRKQSIPQSSHHHGFDGVHTVLGFVEDDGVLGLEYLLGHLDAVQTELFVHVASHLSFQVVVCRQTVH